MRPSSNRKTIVPVSLRAFPTAYGFFSVKRPSTVPTPPGVWFTVPANVVAFAACVRSAVRMLATSGCVVAASSSSRVR